MSYGAFVQACIDERVTAAKLHHAWWSAALHHANKHFACYPEHRVVRALFDLRWPQRPVSVSEIMARLDWVCPRQERRQWMLDLDAGRADDEVWRYPLQVALFDIGAHAEVHLWWLYRLHDRHENLLYVGITSQGGRRFEQHERTQPWWPHVTHYSVKAFRTEREAREAEAIAIWTEGPVHNRAGQRPPHAFCAQVQRREAMAA